VHIEIFLMHNVHIFLQDHESDVQLLPSPLYVDLLMDVLYMYLRQIVHLKHIMRDSCVRKSCYEWYYHVGYIPRKSVSCCIYLSSLIQTSRSPVTTAYTGRILFGKTSPTNNLIAKNVFDGAKRRLVSYTYREKGTRYS
jgi:hypothetical protein